MLRSAEHGGDEDGAWVLLESVELRGKAAPEGAAEGVAAAAVE